jgi:hypothetical protein
MRAHTPKTLVLCEGKADRLVMESLAAHVGLRQNLVFESYDGESKLRENLANLKVSPEYTRGEYRKILVTRDADDNYVAALTSVHAAIQQVFAQTIENPGDWVDLNSTTKITSWIIPGPNQTGMIETLCLNAARALNPNQFNCLDAFIQCLEGQWGKRPHEKVRFFVWTIIAQGALAQDRLSPEYAVKNLDFNWDDTAYNGLKELFLSLES